MPRCLGRSLIFSFGLLLVAAGISPGHGSLGTERKIESADFLSPKVVLGPGSVVNAYYHNIDFPRGHIGLKSFDAEVVDEAGNPVPLHDTYLHHWVIQPYYVRKGVEHSDQQLQENLFFSEQQESNRSPKSGSGPDFVLAKNGGMCRNTLRHFFGLGSETRKTSTHIPEPYGIEVGNPEEIPDGYEFRWLLNLHAIDTRGVEDRVGCTECRCDLYNVTIDEYGRHITPDYRGGLLCCYDKTQCRVRNGFDSGRTRTLYLKYTVRWVDWDTSVLPAEVYIVDITDAWGKSEGSTGNSYEHYCHVEYEVKPCNSNRAGDDTCLDVKRKSLVMPFDGYIVYGVSHQHAGGRGGAIYREDGRLICSSIPKYGKGDEPGNEAGYIVGMSTCYPDPAIKVTKGETLIFESNYSSVTGHTGVMGLFYFLVAQQLPEPRSSLPALIRGHVTTANLPASLAAAGVVCGMVALLVIAAVVYLRQNRQHNDYQSIST